MLTRSKTTVSLLAAALAAIAAAPAMTVSAKADDAKKAPTTLTSFWALPKTPDSLTLVVAGTADPVTVAVAGTAQITGVCFHCTLDQPFKVSETNKNCAVCGCGKPNGCCVAWKDLKSNAFGDMMKALPAGIVLRVTFNTEGKPDSGVKAIKIDRRAVLLPVEGLDGKTPADLAGIVKPAGGAKAELVDGGKRLLITMKADYDDEAAAKLVKALDKAGAKIVKPAAEAAAQ